MRNIRIYLAILLSISCTGCGTFIAGMVNPAPSPYSGVRTDARVVGDGQPLFILDFPFSAVADTVLLPFYFSAQPVAHDPLEGWKLVGHVDYQVSEMSASIKKFPGDKAISDDVQIFINKLPVDRSEFGDRRICYWMSNMMVFESSTGQHAVRIEIPWDGTYWNYVLIYDKDNKRVKKIKYKTGYYRC